MMKLWLLRCKDDLKDDPWSPWFDKAFGFVIRAETEAQARGIAQAKSGEESRNGQPWMNPECSTCAELTPNGPAEVVIRDFRAS